jgi:diguanylate cyclase (GGDEF)-like protein
MDAIRGTLPRALLYGGLYFAFTLVAGMFLRGPGDVVLFWPAAGVGYAVALRYGLRWVAVVPAGLLLYYLIAPGTSWAFTAYAVVGNTLATALGAWLVHRVDAMHLRVRDGMVVLYGGLLLGVASALIGTFGLWQTGLLSHGTFLQSAAAWALSDLLGITVVAPTILLATAERLQGYSGSPRFHGGPLHERITWIALALLSMVALLLVARLGSRNYQLGLVSLPLMLLLWSALRFSTLWTAVATGVSVFILTALMGAGLFGFVSPDNPLDATVLLLGLLLISIIPLLLAMASLEQRTTAEALYQQATRDSLTGLLNRTAFERSVREALLSPQRGFCLLYVDLDNFQLVNDSASHAAGDQLIATVASTLNAACSRDSVVARTGGDEFAVLAPGGRNAATVLARRVLAEIEAYRMPWQQQVLAVTASIGIVETDAVDLNFDRLLSHADAACYAAKELGGNRFYFADPDSDESRSRTATMRAALRVRQALEQGQFVLYCQPVFALHEDAADGLRHYEVLIRWRDAQGGLHAPAELIAAAERFRLAPRLDRRVIDSALSWLEHHPDAAAQTGVCGLNISGASLMDDEFADYLALRFKHSPVPASRLCLEITETSVVRDRARAQRFIARMRALGCRFALDDFGTGFCSFSYLHDLDVDFLKIDGSFVRDLDDSGLAQAVVRSIADIGHVLGKATVAEQVETESQRERMRLMGVDFAQGYLFGRPQPIEDYFRVPDAPTRAP